MSGVTTVTASDFRGLGKGGPRLAATVGDTLHLLVRATDPWHCVGVDLASGALVRAWCAERPTTRLRAYDVVVVTLAGDTTVVPDPSEPEALVLARAPEAVGRIRGRKAEKLLRPLLHPTGTPLLGSRAGAVPFWDRRPEHPSIALVEPSGPIVLRREHAYLACSFTWDGGVREFPCLDRRVAGEMDARGQIQGAAETGTRLLIGLTPPIDGHCHKVVEAVLARP
jgi:hypothetical protein